MNIRTSLSSLRESSRLPPRRMQLLVLLCAILLPPGIHADVPAGGTLEINKTLVRPGTNIVASFSGWVDSDGPLNYQIVVDGLPVGPPSPTPSANFPAPLADGPHTVIGRISDALGNSTEVQKAFTVDGTPPVISSVDSVSAVATHPQGEWVHFDISVTDAHLGETLYHVSPRMPGFFLPGEYNVRITTADAAGNTAEKFVPVSITRGYVETKVLAQAGKLNGALIGTVLDGDPDWHLYSLGVPTLTNLPRIAMTARAKNNATGKTLAGIVLGGVDNFTNSTQFVMPMRVGEVAAMNFEGESPQPVLTWKAFPREPFMDYTDDEHLQYYQQHSFEPGALPIAMGFFARVAGQGVTTENDDVLGVLVGSLIYPAWEAVAREGNDAPGVAGAKFKNFVSVALATRRVLTEDGWPMQFNTMAFTAVMQSGPGGVNRTNDMGLWIWSGYGGPVLVLREGQVIEGRTLRSFVALRGAARQGKELSADDDPDHYGANAELFSTTALLTFTDGTKQLVAVSRESVKPLATARTAEPWAGTGPALPWATFPSWFRNGDGCIGLLAGLRPGIGGVTNANNLAILAEDSDGDLQQLVTKGDVSSPIGGERFLTFKDPVMNRDGALAFIGQSQNKARHAFYRSAAGLLSPFFEYGGEAHATGGGKWKTMVAHTLPDGMGPLFTAKLARSSPDGPAEEPVTAANDLGLWAVDSLGATHVLVREGQLLAGKTVRTFKALTSVPGSLSHARSFNGDRDVLVWVLATDNTQHLVHFDVP